MTQFLSSHIPRYFRIKVRETSPLQAAVIQECSRGEASTNKLTQLLSTVVVSFRIKVRETLPLQAAFIQECSRGEA